MFLWQPYFLTGSFFIVTVTFLYHFRFSIAFDYLWVNFDSFGKFWRIWEMQNGRSKMTAIRKTWRNSLSCGVIFCGPERNIIARTMHPPSLFAIALTVLWRWSPKRPKEIQDGSYSDFMTQFPVMWCHQILRTAKNIIRRTMYPPSFIAIAYSNSIGYQIR